MTYHVDLIKYTLSPFGFSETCGRMSSSYSAKSKALLDPGVGKARGRRQRCTAAGDTLFERIKINNVKLPGSRRHETARTRRLCPPGTVSSGE